MPQPGAVVVNALSRGGSNILWNILQSHPRLCSPIRETGELIFDEITPFNLLSPAAAKRFAASGVVRVLGRRYLRRVFDEWKLRNFQCANNGTKSEGVPYRREEIENSILCFKGVDSDVELNSLLDALYDNVAYIALVRNGYAVCNGWMRRGVSAEDAGRKYASIVRRMLAQRESSDTFVLVKFEDMIRDPFGTAEHLFRVLELEPTALPKLRLKAKRILGVSGEHETRFGKEGGKCCSVRVRSPKFSTPTSTSDRNLGLLQPPAKRSSGKHGESSRNSATSSGTDVSASCMRSTRVSTKTSTR